MTRQRWFGTPTALPRVFIVMAAAAGAGCGLLSPTSSFVIRVESIVAPAAIAAGAPLEIRFRGAVGSDGCSRLTQVEKRVTADSLVIRFHGERRGGDCTQTVVELDHVETLPPPLQDPYTIQALQPRDEAPLVKVVRIE